MGEDQFIDPVSLKILNITKEQAEKDGYKVKPMTLEESYEVNKGAMDNPSPSSYKIFYEDVMAKELYNANEEYMDRASGNKTTTTETENIIKYDPRSKWLVNPNVLGYDNKSIPYKIFESHNVAGRVGQYYDRHGSRQFSFTAEEQAEINGKYYKQDGTVGNISDYKKMDWAGHPFRIDEKGNEKMLVLDPGSRSWVETDSDVVMESSRLRSMYGPKKAESGILENMGVQSWNTIVDETYGATGTVAEMMGTFGGWISGQKDANSWQKWGRKMQNTAGISKSKVSEAVENEGAFGSWRAGLGTAANAITQVASQALVGLVTRGIGNFVTIPLKGLAKGATLAKYTTKLFNTAPWTFGAAYAAQAMNDEAKAAGLDDKSRATMSLLAMGAVYGSEYALKAAGAAGLVDMFADNMLTKQLDDAFRTNIRGAIGEVKDAVGRGMSGRAAEEFMEKKVLEATNKVHASLGIDITQKTKGTGMLENMRKGIANWSYSDKPGSLWARTMAGLGAAGEEGAEEVIEGGLNAFTKTVYNNYWADPNAKPGQGKFQNTSWENPISEFMAGGIGGGTMGFIIGGKRKVNINKSHSIAELALNMDEKDGIQFLSDMHKKGMLDNPLLDADDQFIQSLPKDQQDKAMSLNDIAYNSLKEQLKEAHKIIQMTGLRDSEKITKLMGGDMKLAKDALANMLYLKTANLELGQMQAQLKDMKEGSAEHNELSKQILEQQSVIQQKEGLVKDILDGSAVEKYRALNLIRTFNTKRKAGNNLTQEEISEAFGKSIAELETEDDWTNEEKAYKRVSAARELNQKFDELNKNYDANRKKSQELFDLMSKYNLDDLDIKSVQDILKEMDAHFKTPGGVALRSQFGQIFGKMDEAVEAERKTMQRKFFDNDKVKDIVKQRYDEILEDEGLDETKLTDKQKEKYQEQAEEEIAKDIDSFTGTDIKDLFDTVQAEIQKQIGETSQSIKDKEQSNVIDDRDLILAKGLKTRRVAKGKLEINTYLADYVKDEKEGRTKKEYTVTDNKTKKSVKISQKEYEDRKTDAKSNTDSFVHNDKTYNVATVDAAPGTFRNFKQKFKQVDKNGNPVESEGEVVGIDTKAPARELIADEDNDFTNEIDDLWFEIEAENFSPELVKQAEELKERIQERFDDIQLALEFAINNQYLPESVKKWIAVSGTEQSINALQALSLNVESQLNWMDHTLSVIKENVDIREKLFEDYRVAGFKQMATVSNKLSNTFKDKKVIVDGVELQRPPSFDINNLDESTVLKALQYWHHYVNQTDDADFKESFNVFWNSEVLQLKKDADGKYTTETKTNAKPYGNVKSNKQGMFVEDFDSYIKNSENSDYFANNEDGDNYRIHAYYNWMNIIFNLDVNNYYKTFYELIESDTSYINGAHTSEQMMVMMQAAAHMHENQSIQLATVTNNKSWLEKHDYYKNMMKVGTPATGEWGLFNKILDPVTGRFIENGNHVQDNVMLVSAPGGAGKTSYIVRTILEYAVDALNKRGNIVLVVRNENQLKELKASALEAGLVDGKDFNAMLVTDFIENQHDYKDNLIIIDEVSLLTPQEKNAMYFQNSYSIENGNPIIPVNRKDGTPAGKIDRSNTIFFLGDEFQPPYDPIDGSKELRFSQYVQHTITITQVKRTSFKDIFGLQNIFRKEIAREGKAEIPEIERTFSYYSKDNERKGVRLEDNEDAFFEEAKRVNSVDDAYLVVLTNADKEKAESKGINADKIKVMTDVNNTPQGMTIGEVYVYVPVSYYSNKNEKDASGNYTKIKNDIFMKYMGMAVGRGKNFVMMYSNGYTHKGSNSVDDVSGLDMFQQTKVYEKKQELKNKVDSHVKGTYQTKPQNYAAKKTVKGNVDLTPEEKEKAYQAEAKKYPVGKKIGSYTVTSEPTKVSENEAEFTAENSKESVVYKIGFDGGTNKWSTSIKSRTPKTKRNKPFTKKTLKKELDKTPFKLGEEVNVRIAGKTVTGTVSDMSDVDNPDGGITRTITLFNDGYEDSTVVLTIDPFSKTINYDAVNIGEKLADDESDDDSDGTEPEDNINEDIKIEKNIDDSINRVVYTDKAGKVHFFVSGATYPIRTTNSENVYLKIKLVKDPDTGEVKIKYIMPGAPREGTIVSLDKFISDKLAAETMTRKERTLLTTQEFNDRAMSDLYTKRELYFTGDYFPLFGSETVADEDTRIALFKQRMLEAQKAINQAANSNTFSYRVVLKKSIGVQFQDSSGDAKSANNYFVVEYHYKNPDGTMEWIPVSYISLYDDSKNAYFIELQSRAEKIFSENNGKNEVVITEDVLEGTRAFVPGSILNTKEGTGRMSSTDLIKEMAEKGFLLLEVKQEKVGDQTRTYAYFKNGNIREKVMLEAKQLLDNPVEATKYLEDLIDLLNSATSDKAIENLLIYGDIANFHDYNKSQLWSDKSNGVDWVNQLQKDRTLMAVPPADPNDSPKELRVAGDIKDAQAFKKNMLDFLNAAKNNLIGQNNNSKLRFAPRFDKINRTLNSNDFYTAFNQEVKQPAVIIPLVKKQDALLRAELSQLEKVEYDAAIDQVAAEFDELIGPARGLDFVEGMLGSENAHGKITAFGKIVLNMQNGTVSRRAMYHEVAHYVAEFLLKENERKMLYEEAARKRGLKNFDYYNLSQRRQVAEYFAEAAERYAYDRRNMKGLTKLFTQFLDYIKYVLDRYGLLSDITHKYLYDIYVNKKYSSQESISSEQISEMPYTELYKSEGFKEFSIVEKHFDDSAIARNASRRLGEYTANQILRPNLNSRLFKDSDLPFKDIVNRVENSLRMTAMYKTDDNGYIEVHNSGEFKGMPILITDANGEGLMIEHKDEYIELFKYEKNPVDEEGVKHTGVRLMYFSKKDNKYIVAVPNSKGILFSDSSTKKYIRKSIKEAMKGFMVETFTKDDNGAYKKIPAFPTEKEHKELAKKVGNMLNYKNFMYAAALMDDNIFAAAMNKYLPGINISELLDSKRRQITTSEAMLKLMEQLDSITRENTESVNPMDRLSDLVKFVIRTTPRYYTGVNKTMSEIVNSFESAQEKVKFINDNNLNAIRNEDGTLSILSTVEVNENHPQGKYFNHEEVSKIMFSTMMNNGNNFTDSITRFSDAIKNRINEKIGTYGGVMSKAFIDNEFNILMSMYKEHFSLEKGDISNARIMSWHLEYVKDPKKLIEFYNEYLRGLNTQKQNGLVENTEPALTLQEFEKGLETRSFHAAKIVTSLVTSFGSINTDSYAKIVVYGDRKMPKASTRRMGSESSDQKKMDLERHLYGTMLTAAKSVTEGYVNLLGLDGGDPKSPDGKRNPFTIFAEDGIYYKPSYKSPIKIFNINPLTNTIESVPYNTLGDIDLDKALKSMLSEVFDKDFSYRFVKRLATPVAIGYEKEAGWNQMGQILGPMFLATYSFASNRKHGSQAKTEMVLLEGYEKILANFKAGNPNYGKVTEEAYGAMSNTEATEDTEALSSKVETTDLYHPAGYYEELQKLGDILAVTDGGFMTPYFKGIGGKKIYRDTTQDSIGYNLADGGKNYAQNYASLATRGEINGNFNHVVRTNEFGESVVEFLNPFVGGNNQINPATGELIVTKGFVNEFTFMNGLQANTRQTEFKNLAGINLYDQQIMHFAPSADVTEASFPMRKFYVELYNQGDRSRQRMFSLDWRTNGYKGKVQNVSDGILTMKKTDKKTSYGLDSDNIFKHVVNIFRSTEKIAHNSLVRWSNVVFDIIGEEQISIDGINVLSRQDALQLDLADPNYTAKKNQIRSNIILLVNNLNALGKFNITDNNQIAEFDGTDMRIGVDYVISIQEGQRVVRLGHGTTMNDNIYTKNEDNKENPERVFNKNNFYSKKKIVIDKNTFVWASIEELSRSMDENGDFYVTTKPLKKGIKAVATQTYKVPAAAKEQILYEIFGKQLADTHQKAIKSGYGMSKEYLASLGHDVKGEYKAGIKVSPYKYATVWAANEMAHKIFNMYFTYAFEGSLSQEMDNVINFDSDKSIQWSANNNKRSVMHSSTYTKPTFDGYYGVDTDGDMLFVSSIVMPAFIDGFTSLETNKHKAYDGQSFKSKMAAVMEHNASGEMFNNINKEGMAKTVGISQDLSTGESSKLKHAEHIASYQSMEYMPAERLMQEMFHNPYARKIVEGTNAIISNYYIRTNTVPENQDSIWQRYLIHEVESKYVDAIQSMENIIDRKGGLREYVSSIYKNKTKNLDDIDRIVDDIEKTNKKGIPNFVYYEELAQLMTIAGDVDYIEEPSDYVSYEWAWDKTAKFYYEKRAQGKTGRGKDYRFIRGMAQRDDSIKNKAQTQTLPLNFSTIGATQAGSTVDVRQLNFLTTPSGMVPNDVFETYLMWKQEDTDLPVDRFTQRFNNTSMGFQLNANRNVDDSSESPMIQLMSIILASPEQHDNGDSDSMMKIIAGNIRLALNRFQQDEKKYVNKKSNSEGNLSSSELKLINQFVKEKVKMSMKSIDDTSMLSVIIGNENIDISVSQGAEERVFQYLASYIRKEAIKRKQTSMRLVQAAGNHAELYRYTHQDGSVETFSYNGAIKYIERITGIKAPETESKKVKDAWLLENGFTKDTLKHTTIKLGKEVPEDIQNMLNASTQGMNAKDKSQFITRYYIENGYAVVEKGEALVPAAKFDKYDIPKHTTFNELFRLMTIENGKYTDTRLLDLAFNGKENRAEIATTIRNTALGNLLFNYIPGINKEYFVKATYGEGMKKGDNSYFDHLFLNFANAWIKGNSKAFGSIVKQAKVNIAASVNNFDAAYIEDGKLSQKYYSDMSAEISSLVMQDENFAEMLEENVQKYTSGLIANALAVKDAVGVRTPSGPGSGFYVNVVGFVNDNGSTGYVNTIKNLIDGSDQDIDQFNFYFKDDTLQDLGYSEEEIMAIFSKRKKENEDNQNESDYINKKQFDELVNRNNNALMDLVFKFYANPKNNVFTGSAINMDAINKVANDNVEKLMPNGDVIHGIGMSILYRRASFEGQSTVGNFARGQKGTTHIAKAFWSNNSNEKIFNTTKFPGLRNYAKELFKEKPAIEESFVNSSTDNIKEQSLGKMNINSNNATFVSTSVVNGDEIVDFVRKNPERFGMTKEYVSTLNSDGSFFIGNDEILNRFFVGQAFEDITNFISKQDDTLGYGFQDRLFKSAHRYYSYLTKNNEQANKDLQEAKNNIIRVDAEIKLRLELFGLKIEDFNNNFSLKNIEKVLRTKSGPKYKAIQLALQKEIEKTLGEEDSDIAENLDSFIYSGLKNSNLYDKLLQEGKSSFEIEQYISQIQTEYDAIKDNVYNTIKQFKYRYIQENYIKTEGKKYDINYQREVYLIAKHAMLSEWQDNMTKIIDINQFKITSPYEALKYLENIQMMTGRSPRDLVDLYENFRTEKEKNPSLTAYDYLQANAKVTPEEMFENYENMNKHAIARERNENRNHINESLDYDDGTIKESINFKEDFFTIADNSALLLSMDSIMESIKAVIHLDNLRTKVFATHNAVFTEAMKDMMERAGFDKYNEVTFRKFHEATHDYITADFISRSDKALSTYNNAIKNVNGVDYSNKAFVGVSFSDGASIGRTPKFTDAASRKDFIMQFPVLFNDVIKKQLLNEIAESEDGLYRGSRYATELIQRLEVKRQGGMQYIELINQLTQTSDDEANMRQGFLDLDQNIADLLSIYQIVKSGFEYQKGFLAKVMPSKFYEMYSEYLSSLKESQGLNMPQEQIEDFKKQLLYNPDNEFLQYEKRVRTVYNGKEKWYSNPPLAAYGQAKEYIKTAYTARKNKFGKIVIKAVAQTQESDFIGSASSSTKTGNNKVIPATRILDIHNTKVPVSKTSYKHQPSGLLLDTSNMSMSKYLKYFIKGGFESKYDELVKAKTKQNNLEIPSPEIIYAAANEAFAWVNEQRDNPKEAISKERIRINKLDNPDKSFADAFEEAQNEWYKLVAEKLIENFDENTFAEVYNNLKGGVITSPNMSNAFGSASALAGIFNATRGNYKALPQIKGFASTQDLIIEPKTKMFINRLTTIGHNYNRYINDETIVEIKSTKADKFYGAIFNKKDQDVYNERFNNERNLFSTFISDVVYTTMLGEKQAIATLNNPEYQIYVNTIRNKFGNLSDTDLIKLINDNTNQWVERNSDLRNTMERRQKKIEMNNAGENPNKNVHWLELSRTGDTIAKIGDVIYFDIEHRGVVTSLENPYYDGDMNIKGYKTIRYVLDPNYSAGKDQTMKAVFSLNAHVAKNNSIRTLQAAVEVFAKSMPNVPYEYITNDQAGEMGEAGSASFYKNGVVYINVDKADTAVALHEFAHPFVIALQTENKPLFDRLAEQVMKNEQVVSFVKNNYPELETDEQIIMEAIPTYLQMRMYKRMWMEQTAEERSEWGEYFQWIHSNFNNAMIIESVKYKNALDKYKNFNSLYDLNNKYPKKGIDFWNNINDKRTQFFDILTTEDLSDALKPLYIEKFQTYDTLYNIMEKIHDYSGQDENSEMFENLYSLLVTGQDDLLLSILNVNELQTLSTLDFQNATLNQIADAILNDFTSGNVLSMTNTAKHAIPYTMRASSSSKLKNINISNIDRLFQNKGEQSKEEEARIFINSGINAAIASGSIYTGVSNSYNFSVSNPAFKQDGLFSQQKFETFKEDVIKNEMSYYVGMDNKMLMFFDQLKLVDQNALTAATGTIFMSWNKLYKISEMSDAEIDALNQKVEKMLIHIGYDHRTDKAYTLQEAVAELGITMPTNIVGNPIVIIHNKNTPSQSISILDITTLGLKSHGVGDMVTLGDAFVDSEELTRKDRAKIRQSRLMNTNQDINALKNTIIAMAFKKANPDIKFKKIGSVRITGKDYQPHFMYMEDMVVHVKQLFSIDYFKNSLERDLFELVSDEALLDPNAYKIDVMDKLKDYVETKLAQSEDVKDKQKLQTLKDTIVAVEADHMQAQMKTLAGAIRARLTYLRNQVFGNDTDKIALSDEYYELANMYMDLTAYNDINVAKVTPIDFDEKWLKTVDRWHGKVRTWVFDSLDTAMRKSKELIMPFQEEMQMEVSKLNKANPHINIFTDASHKLFEKVIKKRRIRDAKTGEMVDISMHELHWDENDAQTAKALKSGDLTMTELNFGKWLSNKMYEEFIEYVIEVERSSIAKGNDTPEQLRAAAEMVVSSRYRRGMMPVFSKSFSSALSEGKIMEAYNLFTESAGKWYGGNIYVDYQQSDNPDDELQEGNFHKLLSPFWNQFTSVSMNGSQNRMNMLGVGYENGELVLLNKDRNDAISMNLQNVGLFTKAASTRSRTMREAVANVNIALDILRAEEKQKGVKTDDIIEQIENYVNRQVYGNLPKTGVMQVMGAVLNLDSAFDASGKLIYMIHLAVNPVLGAKNAVSAATKGFISSLANAMSGSKMFTPADVVKAISEVVSNPAKVEKINRKYQLVNITERDLLNHWTNNQTRKNAMETDFQMLFHWFGDHYTQLIGSVAQMINDGTYYAHDENGEYDPDKDTRFEGEDGKLIKEDILRRQTLEGYHAPDANKMTHAYTQRDENRIKVINQRYVGELNDNQYKNMISSFGIARAVMVLRNYTYNVKQFWWSNRRPDVMIGGRKVVDEKVVWEPVMAEGVLNTIVYMIGQVRKGEKIEMDSFRKRNVYAAGASLVVLGSLYFVLDILTEGFDDDDEEGIETPYYERITGILFGEKGYNIKKDKKEINYAQQMLRYILGGGANENLSYLNPLKTFYDAKNQPNALFLQAQNIIDAFIGSLTIPFEVSGLDKDPIMTDIDEYVYSLSKIAPYGSNYRLIRNAIEQILIDMSTEKDFLTSVESNNY